MLKHIVMWKLNDNLKTDEGIRTAYNIKQILENLKNCIDEIIELEVGINKIFTEFSYDLVLTVLFANEDDLNKYKIHPEH